MRPTALFGGTFPNERTGDDLSCRRSVRRGYFNLVRRGWIRIYSFFSSGKVMAKQKNSSVISVG